VPGIRLGQAAAGPHLRVQLLPVLQLQLLQLPGVVGLQLLQRAAVRLAQLADDRLLAWRGGVGREAHS
jgi:hypothetical protein